MESRQTTLVLLNPFSVNSLISFEFQFLHVQSEKDSLVFKNRFKEYDIITKDFIIQNLRLQSIQEITIPVTYIYIYMYVYSLIDLLYIRLNYVKFEPIVETYEGLLA